MRHLPHLKQPSWSQPMYEWLVRVAGPIRHVTGLPFEVDVCEEQIVFVGLASKGKPKALSNCTSPAIAGDEPLTAKLATPSDGYNPLRVLAYLGYLGSEHYR